MLDIRRSKDRYHIETDWLSAYWHFSFDHYYDPANMAFGPLRVFNNDTIQPAKGFGMHPHRDMEIVTYVIRGELEHRDSTGGHGIIHAGEVQRMSAGSGITHSEFNASPNETCELVQVWILPAKKGVVPSYEQKQFTPRQREGKLLSIAAPNGDPEPVYIGQDVTFYVSRVRPGDDIRHAFESGRRGYLFVLDGKPEVNGQALAKGDSVKVSQEAELRFSASEPSDVLLIDLP
jgi:redox-sensitive bicupin YhaK (pirin superfamily)